MEGQRREKSYDDEIDLYELCLVFKRRAKLIVGVFALAVLATVVVSFLLPPVYRGSFVIRVPTIAEGRSAEMFNKELNALEPLVSPDETEKLIKNLDRLREEEQGHELSEALGLDEKRIEGIVEIKADAPRNVKNFVEVTVDVRSPALIKDLKTGIVRFLNENRYVRERISLKRESLLSLKEEIGNNISRVEAVRRLVTSRIRESERGELGFNPIEMDRDVLILKQALRDVDNEIKLLKGFEVVVEPVVPEKPVRPKKVLNVAIAGVLSLFIGFSAAFLADRLDRNRPLAE